jgi:hypothetical protein
MSLNDLWVIEEIKRETTNYRTPNNTPICMGHSKCNTEREVYNKKCTDKK